MTRVLLQRPGRFCNAREAGVLGDVFKTLAADEGQHAEASRRAGDLGNIPEAWLRRRCWPYGSSR